MAMKQHVFLDHKEPGDLEGQVKLICLVLPVAHLPERLIVYCSQAVADSYRIGFNTLQLAD